MFHDSKAFSGFTVNDQAAAQEFYGSVLGLEVEDTGMGLRLIHGAGTVFVYQKDDHQPANYTILNFPVDDIDAAVDQLVAKGVALERYELGFAEQDDKGILRGLSVNRGPDIAWFKDPAGNTLAVLQEAPKSV